jgi:hypothetical protein
MLPATSSSSETMAVKFLPSEAQVGRLSWSVASGRCCSKIFCSTLLLALWSRSLLSKVAIEAHVLMSNQCRQVAACMLAAHLLLPNGCCCERWGLSCSAGGAAADA